MTEHAYQGQWPCSLYKMNLMAACIYCDGLYLADETHPIPFCSLSCKVAWKKRNQTYNPYFLTTLRYKIKARDRYRCQSCNKSEAGNSLPFHVHHIDENKQNDAPSNLITLCNACHGLVHGGSLKL